MRNLNSYSFPPPDHVESVDQDASAGKEDDIQDQKNISRKRKLDSSVSNYKSKISSQSHQDTWTQDEIFMLLDIWGAKYMELDGRKLRKDDWNEMVGELLRMSGVERTVGECRNKLDVLKNKYKEERANFESSIGSNWVFLKKMNQFLNPRMQGFGGLRCRIDERLEENKRRQMAGQSLRPLAHSIKRFGAVLEKVEENTRRNMMHLEKMRQEFWRELEIEKEQIVQRARAEIAKSREMDGKDNDEGDNSDTSVDNLRD